MCFEWQNCQFEKRCQGDLTENMTFSSGLKPGGGEGLSGPLGPLG